MKKGLIGIVIIVVLAAAGILSYFLFFSQLKDGTYTEEGDINKAVKALNGSLDASMELASGQFVTKITPGSYYPEDAPESIFTSINYMEDIKDNQNVKFNIKEVYSDGRSKSVNNRAQIDSIFLNIYYPYVKYNSLEVKQISQVDVKHYEGGYTSYIFYFKGDHLSRRMEWNYTKVKRDYEYFLINEDGIITRYISETDFVYDQDGPYKGTEGKSKLRVDLKKYTLK